MAKSVGQASVDLDARTSKFTSKMRAASKSVQDFQKSAVATSRKFQAAGKKMQKTGAAMSKAITLPAGIAGGLAVKAFADFQTAITEVQKVAGKGIADEMSGEIRDMAKNIPLAQTELANLAAQAARFGIEGSDNIRTFTETVGKMSFATDMAAEEAGTSLAKIITLTDAAQDEANNLGSAIVELGNNFATSENEISEAVKRSGAAATQFGLTAEQTLAFNASLNEVSESASRAGTRLRRVFQELQEPDKVNQVASALGMTSDEFRTMKENAPVDALRNIIKNFDTATEKGKKLQKAFSSTSRQALASLNQNFKGLNDAIGKSSKAFEENKTLQKEFSLVADTLNSKFTILWNRVKDLAISFGKALLPTVKSLLNNLTGLMTSLSSLSDTAKRNIVVWGGLAAAIGPATFALGKFTKLIGGSITIVSRMIGRLSALGASFRTLRAGLMTTGFGALAAIAGTLAVQKLPALIDSFDNTKMAAERMSGELEHVNTLNDEMQSKFAKQVTNLDLVIRKIRATEKGTNKHKEAIKSLKKEYGGYISDLETEKGALKDLNKIRKEVVNNLKQQILVEQNRKKIKQVLNKETEKEQKLFQQRSKTVKDLKINFKNLGIAYTDLNNILSSSIPLTERSIAAELDLNTATTNGKIAAEEAKRVLLDMNQVRQNSRAKVEKLRDAINEYAQAEKNASDSGDGGGAGPDPDKTEESAKAVGRLKRMAENIPSAGAVDLADSLNKIGGEVDTSPIITSINRLKKEFAAIDKMEVNPMINMGKAEAAEDKVDALRGAMETLMEKNALTAESLRKLSSEFRRPMRMAKGMARTMVISGKKMAATVEKSIEGMVVSFAKGMGKMMADATTMKNVGKVIAMQFMDLFTSLGKMMIETAIMVAAFKNSIISAPIAAAVIGGLLVAFSQAAKSMMKSQGGGGGAPKLAEGGVAFGETQAVIGDNKDSRTNPEVVAPLDKLTKMTGGDKGKQKVEVEGKLEGETIHLQQKRVNKRKSVNS